MQTEKFECNLSVHLEEFIRRLNPHDFTLKNKLLLKAQPHLVETGNIKAIYNLSIM